MEVSNNQYSQPQRIKVFPLVTQILSMVLGLIGFILSAVAVSGCSFFEGKPTGQIGDAQAQAQSYVVSGGLFKYELLGNWGGRNSYSMGCTKYPDTKIEEFDANNDPALSDVASWVPDSSSVKAAQAMGAIAAFVAGITMIICFTMLFVRLPRWLFKTLSGLYFFALVCQLLTFLFVDNDVCNGKLNERFKALGLNLLINCNLSTDAHLVIVASLFYLILGVLILVCPTPDKSVTKAICGDCNGDCCNEQQTTQGSHQVSPYKVEQKRGNISVPYSTQPNIGDMTRTETTNPDGSVTITEERVNPDGSKSVIITTKPVTSV